MDIPFFSIFVPAKGRPTYLVDAIKSILFQDFKNFEIVISNNGADAELREVARAFLDDSRIRYVEQPEVLNMPAHWEKVSRDLGGEYVLVVTDRSVLKFGALTYLYGQIQAEDCLPDVISWPWDLYYDYIQVLVPHQSSGEIVRMDSHAEVINIINGTSAYPYCLPRGLNSCVKNSFINELRKKYEKVFRSLNPDFTFGYLCLMNSEKFFYIQRPLFSSQGLKVSNGGNSFSGDASPYFASLELCNPFRHVPYKHPMVQNSIHEDFLAMATLCERDDLLLAWDSHHYVCQCFAEIDAKYEAGILPKQAVMDMETDLIQLLPKESREIQQLLSSRHSFSKRIRRMIIRLIRKLLGSKLELIRHFTLLYRKGGISFKTALEAAGFTPATKK